MGSSSSDSDSSSDGGHGRGHYGYPGYEHKKKDKKDKKDKKHKKEGHGSAHDSAHGSVHGGASGHGVAGHGVAIPGFPAIPGYGAPVVHGAVPGAHGVGVNAQEYYGGVVQPAYRGDPTPGAHGQPGYGAPPSPYGAPPHGAPAPYGTPLPGASPYGAPPPYNGGPGYGAPPTPFVVSGAHGAPGAYPPAGGYGSRDIHGSPIPGAPAPAPTPGHQGAPPPSGFRVPLSTGQAFPSPQQTGPPVAYDADGHSPIFIGSALLGNAVHPCKIAPSLHPPCRVPYGGTEYEHNGRFDLLPFDPHTMEWVETSKGKIPPGRRPIEGGYEEHGGKLYHALAKIYGVRVPGKTGEHLHGANVAFGGAEHAVEKDYDILCWR